MAKLLKLRRGTTSQHGSFTGAEGEVTVDTDKETLVVHDGSTAGGHPVAAEDMANVSSANIAGRLGSDSIATSKIAAGALPTDVTVADANISGNLTIESADIVDDTIVNADINASAAIVGTKLANPISLPDDHKISFGTGADNNLEIFHESSSNTNEIIAAGGDIHLECDNFMVINDSTNGRTIYVDESNSRLELGFDGNHDVYFTGTGSTFATNADFGAGIDVTGSVNATGTGSTFARLTISDVNPIIYLTDTNNNSDFSIRGASGNLTLRDETNGVNRLQIDSAGTVDIAGNLDVGAGVDVTGNITVTGTVDGRDVATDGTKLDTCETNSKDDQTGAEILALINTSNVYTTGDIGRDSTDHINFVDNSQMNVTLNGSNEFRFLANGDFHADGDIIAESTTISSDAKLKESIQVVPNALDKLEQLNGVTFNWIRSGEKSAGVIAQDVLKVLPEAVKEVKGLKDNDTHLTVNYHALTSILIESIKELKAEVEALKAGGE